MAQLTSEDGSKRASVEFQAALLISCAAVLTAIATYQSGQLDGKVRDFNTAALAETSFANDVYNDANAQRAIERDWFFGWLIESENGQPAADYMRSAMPPEVSALIEDFYAAGDDGIYDPFSVEAAGVYPSYVDLPSVQNIQRGNDHRNAAQCAILEARTADNQGEWMDFSTVFLAITLVTGGIAGLLVSRPAQLLVLGTAVVCLVVGAVLLLGGGDYDSARAEVARTVFSEPDTVIAASDSSPTGFAPVEYVGLQLADVLCTDL